MEIELTKLVTNVVYGAFGVVILSTILARYQGRKANHHRGKARVTCRMCMHVYEDADRDRVSKCPYCGIKNGKS